MRFSPSKNGPDYIKTMEQLTSSFKVLLFNILKLLNNIVFNIKKKNIFK